MGEKELTESFTVSSRLDCLEHLDWGASIVLILSLPDLNPAYVQNIIYIIFQYKGHIILKNTLRVYLWLYSFITSTPLEMELSGAARPSPNLR